MPGYRKIMDKSIAEYEIDNDIVPVDSESMS